jgi:glycosyltransferase involved in cell wall biosynthesis
MHVGDGSGPRVAYVCAGRIAVFGRKGESIHVQEVIRALGRRGARVELLASRTGRRPPPDMAAVPLHPLPSTGGLDLKRRERAALDANRDLGDALAKLGPVDFVYERHTLWSHAGMEFARGAGVPGILEFNGPRVEEAAAQDGLIDRAAAERVTARAVAAASAVVAVSDRVAEHLREELGAGDKVHVIPNGVDPRRFPGELLEERAARSEPFTVGWVGWLRSWIGIETLVEAVVHLRRTEPDARLLLVGDGPGREAIERRVEQLGLGGAVRFRGSVAPADIPAELARMDAGVAIYPSGQRAHSSSLKVLEYLASGLAVVAGGADQLADQVRDGETGLLCDPDDPAALARSLGLLAGDRELRQRLGRAGREDVLRRFTWDGVASRILRLAGLDG